MYAKVTGKRRQLSHQIDAAHVFTTDLNKQPLNFINHTIRVLPKQTKRIDPLTAYNASRSSIESFAEA